MKKILIVEDDPAIAALLFDFLTEAGYKAVTAADGVEALTLFSAQAFDLILLDVMLPRIDGFGVCEVIRQKSKVPIIMLTALDSEPDQIRGLDLLVDDYITKPFSLAVLRARVNAQLRRGEPPAPDRVELPPFSFDFGRMEFRRDGVLIELSKTEQKLLRVLVENRGRTLTRAALVDRVWTDGAEYVDENALSVTMKRLRDKLEAVPSRPRFLKTVYGLGYTWASAPKEAP